MKIKQSMVDIIVALYYNTILDQGVDYPGHLAAITHKIKIKDDIPELEGISSVNAPLNLKNRILAMCENPQAIDRAYILSNVRLDVGDDDALYQSLKISIEMFNKDDSNNDEFIYTFSNLRTRIYNFNKLLSFNELAYATYRKSLELTPDQLAKEVSRLQREMEPLSTVKRDGRHPALMNEINYDKIDTVKEAFEEVTDESKLGAPFRTGFSGLQQMLGEAGGIRPGDLVTIGADSHNFKSGLLMHLTRMFITYNKPTNVKEGKKPTILELSLENESRTNNLKYYRMLKAMEGEVVGKDDISPEEASAYVQAKFKEQGWTFILRRYDPTQVTASELLGEVDALIADGHDVKAILMDYATMIEDRSDLSYTDVAGASQRALLRKFRAYCSPRAICFVTPMQLSPRVKDFIEKGNSSSLLVKEIQDLAMYDGGKAVRQEIDLELIIHLEKRKIGDEDKVFLTVARGKHRGVDDTPESHKFFAMEFKGKLGLLDDIDAPSFIRTLPGNHNGFFNGDNVEF